MPVESPSRRPPDVIVHVGMSKTGTSTIQFFLRDNRERLSELGLLYPTSPGQARHTRLGLFVKSPDELVRTLEWPRQKEKDVEIFRRHFRRRLSTEIEDSGLSRVLFSDEALFGGSTDMLRRLGTFTGRIGRTTQVLVYLRAQDAHAISRYQQLVKVGWVRRIGDWIEDDMSSLYDYQARLHRFRRLVAPARVIVRRFEPAGFVGGSLLQDYLDAVGVEVPLEEFEQGANRNESLDAESVEFLRIHNIYRVENEGGKPGLIDNRALFSRLSHACDGPVLSLPDDRLSAFMARWKESNAEVARRYLNDSSGQLFRVARSAKGTTEQRLDPARLDHFLELLELPEQTHGPLRAIAEREARVA